MRKINRKNIERNYNKERKTNEDTIQEVVSRSPNDRI